MQKILNQAIATVKGEIVQKGDALSLLTEHGLIALEPARGRSLPLPVGTCAILSGYPRFSPRSRKIQSLAVVASGFSLLRTPGVLSISGRIFAASDGQIIIQVTPAYLPAFFIPVAGFLPDVQESEIWRLECLLEEGFATLVDGQKLKDAYIAPTLKRKHSKKRQQVAA